MTVAAVELLDLVMTKLAELENETTKYTTGAKEWENHKSPPQIFFRLGQPRFGPTREMGERADVLFEQIQIFHVKIWCAHPDPEGDDREATQIKLNNLIRAFYHVMSDSFPVDRVNMNWVTQDSPAYVELGEMLVGTFEARFGFCGSPEVPNPPVRRATITSNSHAVYVDGEQQC